MEKKHIIALALFGILFLGFIVRIWPIQLVHWWDETVYLQHAEIFAGLRGDNFNEFNLRPPLLSVFLAIGFKIWNSPVVASTIVALLGVLGIFYAYKLGTALYNRRTGIISAITISLTPFIVEHSRTIMTDVPALSFIIAATYYSVKFIHTQKNNVGILAGILWSAAILMRFATLPLFAALTLAYFFFFTQPKKNIRTRLLNLAKPTLFGLLIPLLPYFVWSQIQFGFFFTPFINAFFAVSEANGTIFFYLLEMVQKYTLITWAGTVAFLLIALKKRDATIADIFLSAWFILGLIILSVANHKEERYLISIISLPLIILSSRGIALVTEWISRKKNSWSAIITIVAIGISLFSFSPSFQRLNEPLMNTDITTEELTVSIFVNQQNFDEKTVLYSNNNWPVFAYYTKLPTIKLEPSNETFYEKYPKNMPEQGILIIYKGLLNPTPEWLNQKIEFKKMKEFENAVVYRYTPNSSPE